jgi:hypothetical protein
MSKVSRKPRRPLGVTRTGLTPLRPLHPAEVEAAPWRARAPDQARDVRAPLGPVEAEPAELATGRGGRGTLEPEFGEEAPFPRS